MGRQPNYRRANSGELNALQRGAVIAGHALRFKRGSRLSSPAVHGDLHQLGKLLKVKKSGGGISE